MYLTAEHRVVLWINRYIGVYMQPRYSDIKAYYKKAGYIWTSLIVQIVQNYK